MQLWKSQCLFSSGCLESRFCGKWKEGLWEVCVWETILGWKKQLLQCNFFYKPLIFLFFIWEKRFRRNRFCTKSVFQHLLTFSVFTSIMAEYCTPAQADYHYETKVTANVCRSWDGEVHSWSCLVDQLTIWVFCLMCIQLYMLWLFVQLTHLYTQTKEGTWNIVCKYILKRGSVYQMIPGLLLEATELDMFRNYRLGRCT